jgi:hypothetical protein
MELILSSGLLYQSEWLRQYVRPVPSLFHLRRLFANANDFLMPEPERVSEAAERKTLTQVIDQYIASAVTVLFQGL